MKKTAAVLTSLALSAGATVALAQPAHAAGWITLDRASTGTGRWVATYRDNGCGGTRYRINEGHASNDNSFRTPWYGWAYTPNGRYRIYPYKCFTPVEANFPVRIVLNGPKG